MRRIILSAAFFAITGMSAINAQTTDSTARSTDQTQSNTTTQPAATGDVVSAISQSGYNTTLTAAIKSAGLETTLAGSGPYTVFAPSDQAFSAGSKGDSLLKDQAQLSNAIRGHIVSGKYSKDDIIKALTDGKGTATLNTIDGKKLTLKVNASKNLELSDEAGNTALVTVFDLQGSNGVAHVINGVLAPKQ